jgi:hypothetical protein
MSHHIWDEDEYNNQGYYDEPDEISIYKESRDSEIKIARALAFEPDELFKFCE